MQLQRKLLQVALWIKLWTQLINCADDHADHYYRFLRNCLCSIAANDPYFQQCIPYPDANEPAEITIELHQDQQQIRRFDQFSAFVSFWETNVQNFSKVRIVFSNANEQGLIFLTMDTGITLDLQVSGKNFQLTIRPLLGDPQCSFITITRPMSTMTYHLELPSPSLLVTKEISSQPWSWARLWSYGGHPLLLNIRWTTTHMLQTDIIRLSEFHQHPSQIQITSQNMEEFISEVGHYLMAHPYVECKPLLQGLRERVRLLCHLINVLQAFCTNRWERFEIIFRKALVPDLLDFHQDNLVVKIPLHQLEADSHYIIDESLNQEFEEFLAMMDLPLLNSVLVPIFIFI